MYVSGFKYREIADKIESAFGNSEESYLFHSRFAGGFEGFQIKTITLYL